MTTTDEEAAVEAAREAEQERFAQIHEAAHEGDDDASQLEPDDDAPPPEPGPASTPDDAAITRAVNTLEREADKYTRKVQKIVADAQLGLLECPLCPVAGFVPTGGVLEVDPGMKLAILSLIGEGAPVEQIQGEQYSACDVCAGLGMLATGSKRGGFTEAMCEPCQGKGFIDARHKQAEIDAAPPIPVIGPPGVIPLPPPLGPQATMPLVTQGGYSFSPLPGAASDPHGRMPGHPLWGQPAEMGGL